MLLLLYDNNGDSTFPSDLCILGKLFGRKPFNAKAMMATMKKSWNPSKGLEYSTVGDNLFLFKFNDIVDKKKVMARCPWAIDGSLLFVSDCIGNIQPSKVKLDHCSF